MTNFLTTLRTLDAAATPGPWEWRDRYDFDEHLENTDWDSENFKAGRINLRQGERRIVLEEWADFAGDSGLHVSRPDADLITFLRNHAPALIGCVEALERLRDCDWVITPADRMDAVRTIARDALAALEGGK